ncbi:uncharacterized protein J4E78_009514 [Alternaria triticimaculans]|uniref:uncharacterized protein n=1 Tax=Alternaria triticimaculans TaxID=297637 RepID=UPI0020C3EDB6|nr:uncharacterized protein J4E78_009514 [Alternaria triticimaculans]KAI4644695.1 hypothetical protein J4E78_009514 [Alternaria triticimaculans]
MSEQRDTASVYGHRDRAPDPRQKAPVVTARRTEGGVKHDLPTERDDQPVTHVTHESGDGAGEASTSVQEFAHQSEAIRSLQAENRRLTEAIEQVRIELIAKDARIAELTAGGGSKGAKGPRT